MASTAYEQRREVISELYHSGAEAGPYERRFIALTALAVIIATLGLRDDSEAVVIGAMLIAPLMTPVLGVAGAIVMGWTRRLWDAASLLALATIGSVMLAYVIEVFFPNTVQTVPADALLSRTDPQPVDLGIALAAGAAGAFVQMRRQSLGALPGVAIAVALMPPLAAAGTFFGRGEPDLGWDAMLLYATNLAAIVFAAGVVYLLTGLSPGVRLRMTSLRVGFGMAVALIAVATVYLPLSVNSLRIVTQAQEDAAVRSIVEDWLGDNSSLEIVTLSIGDGRADVTLTGPDEPPPGQTLAAGLSEHQGRDIQLRLRWTPIREQVVDYPRLSGE